MAEIDERIVSMKFDNRQFENGVSTSISTIDKLKKALSFEKQEKAFDQLEKTANSISFSGLQNSLSNIEKWVSPVGNHIVSVFDRAMNFVESKVMKTWNAVFTEAPTQGFKEYELKMDSVQTIMASTGESIETVNGYLDELNLYADKTIYSFSDMTANIGKFTNAGVKLEDAVKAIQGVSNVAAVSGANANEASRAMYNFAQALGSGAVKLIDWKSIENANMATVEFKNQLIETALAVGTLVKEGEQYRSVTTDNAGKVSDLFDATHNFNDALKNQWMTTDVLVKTLAKYTDETTEIGKKAFKAATEVKTFTQLLDTLKEAMGSGWTESFQLIIGDFEEAKIVWTAFSDVLGGIIDKTSTVRNNLIQMWRDAGGRDELFAKFKEGLADLDRIYDFSLRSIFGDKYNSLVKKSASELETVADALSAVTDAEIEAAKHIWYGPNTYGTGAIRKSKLEEEFGEEGAKRVQKLLDDFYTKGQDFVKVEKEIDETTEDINHDFEDFQRTKFGKTLQNLIDTAKNLGKAFSNLMEVGKRLFKIFSASVRETLGFDVMSEDVESFSGWIVKLTEKLLDFVKQQKNIYKIREAFDTVMKVVNKLWEIFVGIVKSIGKLFDTVNTKIKELKKRVNESDRAKRLFEALTKIFENLKDWIVKTKDAFVEFMEGAAETENGQKVVGFLDDIKNALKGIAESGLDWIIEKLEGIANAGFEAPDFNEIFGVFFKLPDLLDKVNFKADEFKTTLSNAIDTIGEATNESGDSKFANITNVFKNLFKKDSVATLKDRVKTLWDGILDNLGDITFGDVVQTTNLLLFVKAISAITDTFKTFKTSTKSITKSITGVIDGFKGVEKAAVTWLKADAAVKIAKAIAIIAAAIFALAMLDQNKLAFATGVILVVSYALSALIKAFAAFEKNKKGMNVKVAIGDRALMIIAIGGALLLIAKTLATVFDMLSSVDDWETIIYTLEAAIVAMSLMMVSFMALATYADKNLKDLNAGGAIGLVALAGSLYIMANAFKVLATAINGMSVEQYATTLAAFISLLGLLGMASRAEFKPSKLFGVSAALIVMSAALFALIPALTAFKFVVSKDSKGMEKALKTMGIILGALIAVAAVLTGLEKLTETSATGALLSFAGAMLAIAGSLYAVSIAIKPLAEYMPELGLITAGIVALSLVAYFTGDKMKAFGVGLLSAAGAVGIVAASFLVWVVAIRLLGDALPHLASGFIKMVEVLNDGKPQIMAGLADLFEGIGYTFVEGIPYIVTFIVKLIQGIIEGFRDGIRDILLALLDLVGTVLTFIIDIMDPVVDKIMQILAAFFYALASGISKNGGELGRAVAYTAEALINVLISAFATLLMDGIMHIIQPLVNGLKAIIEPVINWFIDRLNAIKLASNAILGTEFELTEKANWEDSDWSGFEEEYYKTLDDFNAERAKRFADAEASFKKTIEDSGESLGGMFAKGVQQGSAKGDMYANMYGGKNAVEEAKKSAEKSGTGFVDKLAATVADKAGSALNADALGTTDLANAFGVDVAESLQNEQAFQAAQEANINAYSTEMINSYPQTEEEGRQMSKAGAKGAADAQGDYEGVATNIALGFAKFLRMRVPQIYHLGIAIGNAVKNGVTDSLQIESPSRVMMKYGEYTVEGLADGITDNQRMAETASEALGNTVVASVSSPLEKIAAILRGEEEYDPTIRPVLDLTNVREGASEISGYFANRSVELASINGRLNANNLAAQRALDFSNQNGSKDVVNAIGLMRGDINALNETMANTELVMDSGAVVGAIKRPMDNALGRMNMLKGRRN